MGEAVISSCRYVLFEVKSIRLALRYVVYDFSTCMRTMKFYDISGLAENFLRCNINTSEFRGRNIVLNEKFAAGQNEIYTIIAEGNTCEELALSIPWLFL